MDPPHAVTEFDPLPLDVHSKLLGVGNRRPRILHAVIEFHVQVPADLEMKVPLGQRVRTVFRDLFIVYLFIYLFIIIIIIIITFLRV